MKVYLKTDEGKRYSFPLPMFLVRFGLWSGALGSLAARHFVDTQTRNILEAVDLRALSRCLKDLNKYKGLHIVDIKAADGQEVKIII